MTHVRNMMDHDVCCKTCEAMIAMNTAEWVAECNCEFDWSEMAKLNASWNTKESEIGGDRANCFTELERLIMVSSSPGLQLVATVTMLGWAHWKTLLVSCNSSIDHCLHCITDDVAIASLDWLLVIFLTCVSSYFTECFYSGYWSAILSLHIINFW